jgi:hypothetical protein
MNSKKKFKDTNFGKGLGGLIKGVAKSTPVLGDIVENLTSQDGGEGRIHFGKLAFQVIRIIVLLFMIYEYYQGNIPLEKIIGYGQ